MHEKRFICWVNTSQTLKRVEPFMVPLVQGLGRLDVHLILEDKRFSELQQKDQNSIDEAIKLTDRVTYSYLWVLGAYELVRALDQRCRENPSLLSSQMNKRISKAKHHFERLRIPLAKMEPSRRHRDTDASIAYPAIHEELGISWRVSKDVFISRRELSDVLLALLQEIANTCKTNAV
jgi:hypothetical protein